MAPTALTTFIVRPTGIALLVFAIVEYNKLRYKAVLANAADATLARNSPG
jgi:hypothetical protein